MRVEVQAISDGIEQTITIADHMKLSLSEERRDDSMQDGGEYWLTLSRLRRPDTDEAGAPLGITVPVHGSGDEIVFAARYPMLVSGGPSSAAGTGHLLDALERNGGLQRALGALDAIPMVAELFEGTGRACGVSACQLIDGIAQVAPSSEMGNAITQLFRAAKAQVP